MGRSRKTARAGRDDVGRPTRRGHPLARATPLFGPLIAFSALITYAVYGVWWGTGVGAVFLVSAAVSLQGRRYAAWQRTHPRFMFLVFSAFDTTLFFGWVAILHHFYSRLPAWGCLVITAAAGSGLVAAGWRQQKESWRRFVKHPGELPGSSY